MHTKISLLKNIRKLVKNENIQKKYTNFVHKRVRKKLIKIVDKIKICNFISLLI